MKRSDSDTETEAERPLVEIGLRPATLGALQRQGITTVAALCELTSDDLVSRRGFGPSRLMEARQARQRIGYHLRPSKLDSPERFRPPETERLCLVRLTCCSSSQCRAELHSAGAGAIELDRLAQRFVALHRDCPRLGGHQPIAVVSSVTRPSYVGRVTYPSARRPASPRAGRR